MIEPITLYRLRCDNCKEVIRPDYEHTTFTEEDLDYLVSLMLLDGECLFKVGEQVVCEECRYLGEDDKYHVNKERFVLYNTKEYISEVHKVYPKAYCGSYQSFADNVSRYVIHDGKPVNIISGHFESRHDAWKDAYSRIKNQNK